MSSLSIIYNWNMKLGEINEPDMKIILQNKRFIETYPQIFQIFRFR